MSATAVASSADPNMELDSAAPAFAVGAAPVAPTLRGVVHETTASVVRAVQRLDSVDLFRGMNVQKYPPSLLYLLATLGPCLLVLSFLDGRVFVNPLARAFITYGRVPMFFYLLQWIWAHGCGLLVSAARGMPLAAHFQSRAETFLGAPVPVFGGTLGDVYVCWFVGAIALYFPCRWYAGVKARRKDLVLLRYL